MADPNRSPQENPKPAQLLLEGDHGCDLQYGSLLLTSLPKETGCLASFEVCAPYEQHLVCSRQHEGASTLNVINLRSVVQFIHCDCSHTYPAEAYPQIAPLWHDRLAAEARVLARSIQGNQAIVYEFLEEDGSATDWLCARFANLSHLLDGKKTPGSKDFGRLLAQTWEVSDSLNGDAPPEYSVMHKAGCELRRIREENRQLMLQVCSRLQELNKAARRLATGAKVAEDSAELTEDTAFWLVDLYGQATLKEPFELFLYRFGVLMIRAGAHGAGVLLADHSGRAALDEFFHKVEEDLPKDASGMLTECLHKTLPNPKHLSPVETFAEELIRIVLFAVFEIILFLIFDAPRFPAGARLDQELIKRLSDVMPEQIVTAMGRVADSAHLKNFASDDPLLKRIETIGSVVTTIINSSYREFRAIQDTAKTENRQFMDVFPGEGGWALIRIIHDVGKAVTEKAITSRMESRRKEEAIEYYRELILSITLDVSERKHALSVEWKNELPQRTRGKDKSGCIGIAKLQHVAGQPAKPAAGSPVMPSRSARKSVKTLKTSGPSAREKLQRIGPAYTPETLARLKESNELSAKSHMLHVVLTDEHGKTIGQWYELSERGVGMPGAKRLGHTEQKALARIENMNPKPGWRILFVGHLYPCNLPDGCANAMLAFCKRANIPIDYWTIPGDNPKNASLQHFDNDGRETIKTRRATGLFVRER